MTGMAFGAPLGHTAEELHVRHSRVARDRDEYDPAAVQHRLQARDTGSPDLGGKPGQPFRLKPTAGRPTWSGRSLRAWLRQCRGPARDTTKSAFVQSPADENVVPGAAVMAGAAFLQDVFKVQGMGIFAEGLPTRGSRFTCWICGSSPISDRKTKTRRAG